MSNEAGGIDANLLRMRSLMDDLDNLIVGYILVRIATARLIIKAKKEHGIQVEDLDREEEILRGVRKAVHTAELEDEEADKICGVLEPMFKELIALGKELD